MRSTIVPTVAVCCAAALAAAHLAVPPAAALQAEVAPDAGSPLRLIEAGTARAAGLQTAAPRATNRPEDRRRLLQNTSASPIAAWHFACVFGLADGRSGWIGKGSDAFPGAPEAAGTGPSSLLDPGEAVVVTLPEPPPRESPYEVWSCGPTAAIYADGGTWGAPQTLDRLFARRLDDVREAKRLLRALERLDEAATYRRLGGAEVTSALAATLPEARWGRYRGEIAAVTDPDSVDDLDEELGRLETKVRDDLARMLDQLRPADRLRLLDEGGD